MNLVEINNYFGDMDLFLVDAILKGHIAEEVRSVLDVGCGEGRNGVYFMQRGLAYAGWDTDSTKLSLLAYLAKKLGVHKCSFEEVDLRSNPPGSFDLVLCARLLHFAKDSDDFTKMSTNLKQLVRQGGLLYVSLDSTVDTQIAQTMKDGKVEFPDGKIRLPLTPERYEQIKRGFEEIEPLKTVIYHGKRAQSFMLLRKC